MFQVTHRNNKFIHTKSRKRMPQISNSRPNKNRRDIKPLKEDRKQKRKK